MTASPRLRAPLLLLALAATCRAQGTDPPAPAVERVTVRATAHFAFDRTTVLPADQASMLSGVAAMTDVTWRSVAAEGHADSVGTAVYNDALALRRARAVRGYLLGKGLAPDTVSATGAGAARPVADNVTARGRAANRRVELTFEGVRPAR